MNDKTIGIIIMSLTSTVLFLLVVKLNQGSLIKMWTGKIEEVSKFKRATRKMLGRIALVLLVITIIPLLVGLQGIQLTSSLILAPILAGVSFNIYQFHSIYMSRSLSLLNDKKVLLSKSDNIKNKLKNIEKEVECI